MSDRGSLMIPNTAIKRVTYRNPKNTSSTRGGSSGAGRARRLPPSQLGRRARGRTPPPRTAARSACARQVSSTRLRSHCNPPLPPPHVATRCVLVYAYASKPSPPEVRGLLELKDHPPRFAAHGGDWWARNSRQSVSGRHTSKHVHQIVYTRKAHQAGRG